VKGLVFLTMLFLAVASASLAQADSPPLKPPVGPDFSNLPGAKQLSEEKATKEAVGAVIMICVLIGGVCLVAIAWRKEHPLKERQCPWCCGLLADTFPSVPS
jgi:hypothetical protein